MFLYKRLNNIFSKIIYFQAEKQREVESKLEEEKIAEREKVFYSFTNAVASLIFTLHKLSLQKLNSLAKGFGRVANLLPFP